MVTGMDGASGPLFFFEPAFRISDKLLFGLKLEAGSRVRGLSRSIAIDNPKTTSVTSLAYTQFYFGKKYFRSFIGIGAGITSASAEVLVVNNSGIINSFQIGDTELGFVARAGVEWGHLNIMLDFNFAGDEIVSPFLEIKNSYPSIRIGALIGGGIN